MKDAPPTKNNTFLAQWSPSKSCVDFIEETKNSQLAQLPDFPAWDKSTWDLSAFTNRSSLAAHKANISWHFVSSTKENSRIPDPWSDLLKALMVRKLTSNMGKPLLAGGTVRNFGLELRKFAEACIASDLKDVTEVSKEFVSEFVTLRNSGKCIVAINFVVNQLTKSGCAPQLESLKPFRQEIGSSQQVRPSNVKPINWDDFVALAATYQLLEPDKSRLNKHADYDYMLVYAMLANLLAAAPARISELWRLPADCCVISSPLEEFGEQIDDEKLDFKFGLCWFPVKGGRPVVKPIPAAMQKIAHRCIEVLMEYSHEARKSAEFIINNPGVIPIPLGCDDIRDCRDTGVISAAQIHRLLGTDGSRPLGEIGEWKKFRKTKASRTRTGNSRTNQYAKYCFRTFEKEWWDIFLAKFKKSFQSEWPYVVNEENYQLRADKALLLLFKGQISSTAVNKSKLFFDTPSVSTLGNLLRKHAQNRTIWERLEITLPNGQSPEISTHQIRHFLNTIAQRAGVPEPIIAMWSGRVSIAQNATYDHRTDSERLRQHGYHVQDYDHAQVDDLLARQVDQAFVGSIGLPSAHVLNAQDETIKDLQRRRLISVTQIGFCVGDTRSEPCPHAMGCLNCARFVVCKGAENAKRFVEQKITALEKQLTVLRHHLEQEGGVRIRNKHIVPHLEEQIDGAKDMLLYLNDPNVEDGAVVPRADYCGALDGSFSARVESFLMELQKLDEQKTRLVHGKE